MTTWKKAGLTALAGSMVAFSAQAVEVAVTGSMKMTYTADSGAQDTSTDGNRFGMSKAVQLSGSGEMDNGWIVSLTNSNIQGSHASLAIDMGDAGTLTYQNVSGGLGIGKIGGSAMESIARQPEAGGKIQTAMIIAAALIEGVALFGVVVCLLISFKS